MTERHLDDRRPGDCEALAAHHEPDRIAGVGMSCVLHLRDVIVHGLDLDGEESELLPGLNSSCGNAAGFSPTGCQALFSKVESGLGALSSALAAI